MYKNHLTFIHPYRTHLLIGDIENSIQALRAFRDERDWGQFHDSKNLASALSIEADELNELFLWKDL